jgi:hypothetical protein
MEIDLDGNVIWIRGQEDRRNTIFERGTFSQEFKEHIKKHNIGSVK